MLSLHNMKRCKFIFAVIICLMFTGCADAYRDIAVTNAKVLSISPQGFTAFTASLELDVHNPAGSFVLADIYAHVRVKDMDMLVLTADRIDVKGHCDDSYILDMRGNPAEGVSIFKILQLFDSKLDINDVTVSFSASVSKSGKRGKIIETAYMPLATLLRK